MVAKLMELANTLFRYRGTSIAGGPEWDEAIRLLLLMLAPAAPHITEELWSRRLAAAGEPWSSIHTQRGPRSTSPPSTEATREVPVQVNGKLRDAADRADSSIDKAALEQLALSQPEDRGGPRRPHAATRHPRAAAKLINIVVRD